MGSVPTNPPKGSPPAQRGQPGTGPMATAEPENQIQKQDPAPEFSPMFPFGKPLAGAPPPNAVPFDSIRAVALWSARRHAGPELAIGMNLVPVRAFVEGPVIPYVDFGGKTMAYSFDFRVDGESFPADYQTVAQQAESSLGERKSRYMTVLVSATYDQTPVLLVGDGASRYYGFAGKAVRRAIPLLSVHRPVLRRIYMDFPETCLQFEGFGRSVLIPSCGPAEDASAFLPEMMRRYEEREVCAGANAAALEATRAE